MFKLFSDPLHLPRFLRFKILVKSEQVGKPVNHAGGNDNSDQRNCENEERLLGIDDRSRDHERCTWQKRKAANDRDQYIDEQDSSSEPAEEICDACSGKGF